MVRSWLLPPLLNYLLELVNPGVSLGVEHIATDISVGNNIDQEIPFWEHLGYLFFKVLSHGFSWSGFGAGSAEGRARASKILLRK
jgi:hypothetical protein